MSVSDQPIWQSKEWEQARKELLEDSCQQCGTTEELALVHLWKPPRYVQIRIKVEAELVDQLVEKQELEPFDPIASGVDSRRSACPDCHSVNIRRRKTKLPPFKCGRCGHEFAEPVDVMVRDDYLFNQVFRLWKETHLLKYEEQIEQRVEERRAEYDRRYRSGEGTTTFCRKCAFLFTQKGMVLCRTCKEHYHKRRYEQCYSCNQQNRGMVNCDKCGEEIVPQPGDINICEVCLDKMWDELTE